MLSADLAHVSAFADLRGLPKAVGLRFISDSLQKQGQQLFLIFGFQSWRQIQAVSVAETGLQLAFAGEPDPVAAGAEGIDDCLDEPNRS